MNIKDIVIGKKYRIREWDDMAKEFGTDERGDIYTKGDMFFREMKVFCGKEVVVRGINHFGLKLKFDDGQYNYRYNFTADMIEPIDEEDKMPIEIKDGYIVVFQDLANKSIYRTIAMSTECDHIYCSNEITYFDLNNYKNKDMSSGFYKIIKVYGKRKTGAPFSFSLVDRELIYDVEPKQMTKAEIEKILGYSIDIIG